MVDQKHGKILDVASISSKPGHPAQGAYASSKGALIQLTTAVGP